MGLFVLEEQLHTPENSRNWEQWELWERRCDGLVQLLFQ